MPTSGGSYKVDLASLPLRDNSVGLRINTQILASNKSRVLLLYPSREKGFGPWYTRYVGSMSLTTGSDMKVQGTGQLVVTGRRLLVMVTDGTFNGKPLGEKDGYICGFSIDHDDIVTTKLKSNWRGKPVEVTFASSDQASPWFVLHIVSVAAWITDDGKVGPTTVERFLKKMSPESRAEMLKPVETASNPAPKTPEREGSTGQPGANPFLGDVSESAGASKLPTPLDSAPNEPASEAVPTAIPPSKPNPFSSSTLSTPTRSQANPFLSQPPSQGERPSNPFTDEIEPIDPLSATMRTVEMIAQQDERGLAAAMADLGQLSPTDIVGALGNLGQILQQAKNVTGTQAIVQRELEAVDGLAIVKQGVEALGYCTLVDPDVQSATSVVVKLAAVNDPADLLQLVVLELVFATGRAVKQIDLKFNWA